MLVRWEPFREMRRVHEMIDRLMDEAFARSLDTALPYEVPALDMYETPEELVVKVSLPGVDPKDVDISVAGDTLTIRGERKQEQERQERDYLLRERRFGAFARSIRLPVPVVADKAQAVYEHGVLTLTLPKAEEVKPKSIQVKVK